LNIALAASVTRIDWAAHLGGFVAGMIACAGLDIANDCSQDGYGASSEYVKMNGFVAFIVTAYCWNNSVFPLSQQNIWVFALGVVVVSLAAVKRLISSCR
jgi:rhomboid protease GluP